MPIIGEGQGRGTLKRTTKRTTKVITIGILKVATIDLTLVFTLSRTIGILKLISYI